MSTDDARLNLRMGPKEYARIWYADKVDGFVSIAERLIEEGITEDGALASEIHEWISAPDSFFHWTASDQESSEMAEAVLRVSNNADIAVEDGGQWDEEDDSQWEFLAAHALVADVMQKIGRQPGPYHGDYEPA